MALRIEHNKYKGKGYVPIFFLHVIPLLIVFAIILALILGLKGSFNALSYIRYYKSMVPFTVLIPILIAVSTAYSYRRVIIHIAPAEKVNVEKLKDFFFRNDYLLDKKSSETVVVFRRQNFRRRFLSLNYDCPFIEISPMSINIVMLRRLSTQLLVQFNYSKKYELNIPEKSGDE